MDTKKPKDFEVNSWRYRFGRDTFQVKIDGQIVVEECDEAEASRLFAKFLKERA